MKSRSQPFAVGLVVAVPAAQGGGKMGEKNLIRRPLDWKGIICD